MDMTVRQFCERYRRGDFAGADKDVQIEAGWFDWFCPEEELKGRLDKIWEIFDGITSGYILDNYSAIFENHCPYDGPLYDVVYFKPVDEYLSGKPAFSVEIGNERIGHKYSVITERNDYEKEFGTDSLKEVQDFINNWETTLQDKSFYEERDRRNAEMKSLCDKAEDLLGHIEEMLGEEKG